MKRRISIRTRIFLEIGTIIAVCLIVLSFVNSKMLENVYLWNAERELKSIAQKIEDITDGSYESQISSLEVSKSVSVDLYDSTDDYIYEGSGAFISGKNFVISRTEFEDGSYLNILSEEGSSTQFILFGKDFNNGFHVEITSQKDPIQENASIATFVTTALTMAALFFVLIFISLYVKRFTKPLIKMSEVTSKMSNLDFSEKLSVNRNDEIGALAGNINTLSTSLDTALTELKTTNEQLAQDIEKERTLDNMRKEFTSSASHELKTPIAIIRGYAEGLKMTLPEDDVSSHEYCDIIMNEADKMNSLVLNLLEMSLYSSGANKPNKDEFSLNEFIKTFMKKTKPIFAEKGINASFEENEDCTVYGDEKQLENVLSNLISNACSHTKDDKIINVFTDLSGEKAVVNVYNSNSHIDDKDKDNIFSSFYRADKAHSRAEGRFGLGLSIVKSIMDLHGCDCGFRNEENGVTFWFEIEKYDVNKI